MRIEAKVLTLVTGYHHINIFTFYVLLKIFFLCYLLKSFGLLYELFTSIVYRIDINKEF